MDVETRHLRHFLAVAEAEHFGRAAAVLHMAQPALSQSIRRLEEATGLVLFTRHPRGATPTDEGRRLLAAARSAVAAADEVAATVARLRSGHSGTLRVGFLANAANELTPEILTAFRAVCPDVELSVVQAGWHDPHAHLDDADPGRRVDVAILRLPLGDTPGITTEVLFDEPCDVVLPTGHPLVAREVIHVRDLLDEPLLHNTRAGGPFRDFWMLERHRDSGHPARVVGTCTTPDEWLTAVAAGVGISVCPRSAGRFYSRAGVVFRRLAEPPVSRVALAWRDNHLTQPARVFLDTVRRVRDTSPLLSVAAGAAPAKPA